MFAMGLGSYLTKLLVRDLLQSFVWIEIAISLVGGLSSIILFLVFPWVAFYRPVMYSLIVIIGTLVGMEIPILTRILSRTRDLRQLIADVLSLDYLGALIGSIGFPLLLLPFLGLFRSSFAIGLLNVGVAFFSVFLFRKQLKRPALMGTLVGSILVILFLGVVLGTYLTSFAEGQLFADQVIYREQTPYQRIVVTRSESSGELHRWSPAVCRAGRVPLPRGAGSPVALLAGVTAASADPRRRRWDGGEGGTQVQRRQAGGSG